ncbi:2Fe-2S iron-sulfur cluster-binding protein [Streptomyces hainanensis]|uniref:2Fe-2S iron-sulfur cluster binding domain-containing protein n=1 Tax=Streptomyces hainanensis TaxID=402648 RepID=A0A4R4T5Z3_9ACTN|nr:2Fe-2S iron-sulfur cluster-binding protein [Streptomyces hainanensis]TDC70774.1 2Fe-2S iron-sulfur cluster binding domain-containing protein [Streptomyces hainanensis]
MTAIDLGLPRRMVEFTLDDTTVLVPEGATILDAVRATGGDLPTLCHGDTLTPANVCRLCMVEVEGSRTLVPSCSRRAEPGMVVRTATERARHSRRLVLELLGSASDLSTTPNVADWMAEYGAEPARFGPPAPPRTGPARPGEHEETDGAAAATVGQPATVDNDLYVRDYGKCILCYKCVDACGDQWQNTFALTVAGRGFDAGISTEYAAPLPDSACVYCGNCIEVCPTGALSFKAEYDHRTAGTWDESAQTETTTLCTFCGTGCSLTLHVQEMPDGAQEIVKVTSPHDSSVTHGNLCIKGRFGWQHVQRTGPPVQDVSDVETGRGVEL